jgi:hypothetical protein
MQVFDDKIYILDISADNKLCVFDKAGSFLYQIGNKGNGPGEYINATDFTIDRKGKRIYILDNKTGNIIKYRAEDGQPEGSLLIEDFRTSSGIQFHNSRLYIDANSKGNGKDDFLLEELDLNDGLACGHWLKASEYNRNWMKPAFLFGGFLFSRTEGDPKYVQLFMDTIVSIGENTVEPFIAIKTKDWITAPEIEKIYEKGFYDFFGRLTQIGRTYGIHDYAECGDNIFFSLFRDGNTVKITYNTNTKESHLYEHLMDDILFSDIPEVWGTMFAADANGIYFVLSSFVTNNFAEYAVPRIKSVIKDNYKDLADLNGDSNPLIIYYECIPRDK